MSKKLLTNSDQSTILTMTVDSIDQDKKENDKMSEFTTSDVAPEDVVSEDDTVTEATTKAPKTKGVVSASVPLDFEAFFEAEAAKLDVSSSELLRMVLHDKYGYDFPASQQGRRKVYATEEERLSAQKSASVAKNTASNILAELLAAGKLDLSEMNISQEQIDLLKALKITKTRKPKETPVA